MQLQVINIHRRRNGTVDMDVYRQKAFVLRREATNQILRRLGCIVRPLIGAIAIPVSYVLLLPRNPMRQGTALKFARAKVAPLTDSLRTPKPNHRSQ
jgi:hypothetical protein